MASPLPTLLCKGCGYANESQRVYCHNCGVKLDRDLLAAQEQRPAEPSAKRQREVKKIMSPERGSFGKLCKTVFKTLALAALAGALIDAALPPEGFVPGTTKGEEATEAPQIDSILENLSATHDGKRIALREADVNAYLRRERFKKLPSWLTDALPLKALVQFEEGTGRLTFQASVAGYPLRATLSGNLKIDKDAKLVATCTGGNIGRLPIPAELARYAGWALPTLLDSMKHERQLLGELGSIEIGQHQIILGARKPYFPIAPGAPNGVRQPAVH